MKQPLTGISLKLFRAWTYLFAGLMAALSIVTMALFLYLRALNFFFTIQSVLCMIGAISITIGIRTMNRKEVTPENVLAGLLRAGLVCILIVLFIAAARRYWSGVPFFLYGTVPVLLLAIAPIFALDEKSTFAWFKFKGIA